jgi:hypothetical protein
MPRFHLGQKVLITGSVIEKDQGRKGTVVSIQPTSTEHVQRRSFPPPGRRPENLRSVFRIGGADRLYTSIRLPNHLQRKLDLSCRNLRRDNLAELGIALAIRENCLHRAAPRVGD